MSTLVHADRVRETTSVVGTGIATLTGITLGRRTFLAGVGNGNRCHYVIENPLTGEWEAGIGTVGAGTLSRDLVFSGSNGASLVSFTSGVKYAWVDIPSDMITRLGVGDIRTYGEFSATDNTAILQAAIDANPGGEVVLERNKTYKFTDAVSFTCKVNARFSTLQFDIVGDKEAVQIEDNGGLVNATVIVNGSGLSGTGGNLHTPINVGKVYQNIGAVGFELRHLTVSGNRVNGNGILVASDSSNGRIEDITFPDSSTMGRPILLHWGGDGGVPPTLTTHPNNITVDNIKVGVMTYSGAADLAAVFVSACYNVQVRNVTVEGIYHSVISVVTGDYGFERAAAAVKPLANQAITIDGVTCEVAQGYGVYVNSVADNQAGSPVISTPVILRNIKTKGIGTGATKSGFRALEAVDVVVENCEFTHHLRGFEIEASSKRIWIRGGRAFNNEQDGVYVGHASNAMDCIVEGVESYLNGQAAGFWAGIFVGGAQRIVLRNNRVGHPVSETGQIYGIRTNSDATALSVLDNYVWNTKATGIGYSLGSGGDNAGAMIWEFRGNGAAATVPNFRNGITIIPIRRRIADVNSQLIITEYSGDATIPTTGTWVRGDTILWDQPPESGNTGSMCTASGTPGTWTYLRNVFVGPTAPASPFINDLHVDTS